MESVPPYYFSAIADIHKYMYVLVARNFDLFVDECKLHECKLHYVITKQTVITMIVCASKKGQTGLSKPLTIYYLVGFLVSLVLLLKISCIDATLA